MSGLLSYTSSLLRDWYGLPLAALAGLLAALYYVLDPDVMRPIFDDSYISLASWPGPSFAAVSPRHLRR